MDINYLAVLLCGVVAMAAGFVWYGPLFGKLWMRVNDMDSADLEARQAMAKSAGPLYGVQLVLSLLQAYILAHFIQGWTEAPATEVALWLWLGFIMPTVAAASMWNAKPGKVRWTMFLLQAGCSLLTIILFALILSNWR